ncbi:diguanylate cyclase [Sulfurovum sp.]|uniref:two-component system response regulator n=1 Tax=Sulfurovum sp. TaxID=1969726 RepID=UPI0025E0178A|nr:diguanylate cyclase [Sulfurovum sp.]
MALENFTLLYVEDDPQTQETMGNILEAETKVLYQACNGKEGLALYREKQPDIVLSDINMPEMDGLEMAAAIREIDPLQPIIITSAFNDRETLLKAVNLGIDGFVTKPVDLNLLLEKLERVAQNLQNRIDAERAREEAFVQKEKALYEMAHYDALTGIPNRSLFSRKLDAALQHSIEEENSMALLFIDLDNFKSINDNYGHQAGDAVLKEVVKNIKNTIRKSDFIARIGGDEFAIVIENIMGKECLGILAGKIIQAVQIPVYYQAETLSISCSIGITIYAPDDNTKNKDALVHNADLAMYEAKKRGKAQFVFWDEM